MITDLRLPTAYHEAGHAVAALAQGRRVLFVSIVPDAHDGSLGHCVTPWPEGFSIYDDDAKRICQERVVWLVAAREAQELATGTIQGDGGDQESFMEIAVSAGLRFHRDTDDAFNYAAAERRYRRYARRLLRAYWPAVEAVAAALLRQDSLAEPELRNVAEQAQREANGSPLGPQPPNPLCKECGARLLGQGSGEVYGQPDCCLQCALSHAAALPGREESGPVQKSLRRGLPARTKFIQQLSQVVEGLRDCRGPD